MTARVKAYLMCRRALGYKLRIEGQMLQNFAQYADRSGHRGPVTKSLAVRWAALPQNADRLYHARRLEVVRVFAKYQTAIESSTEIPPRHAFGPAHRRSNPHLYSPTEIGLLLQRTAKLPGRLRAMTYRTLFGLLACTGLRISEALALPIDDVDLDQGVLTIRESKYHQTRLVPLHPSAVIPLKQYANQRHTLFPHALHFFVSSRGGRFAYSTVRMTFRKLVEDFMPNSGRRHVRLHDLRHTFACRVLLRWQRSKKGASGRLIVLSRYLGHQRVTDTYWYLTSTPELLTEATRHFVPSPI
jgi:integrase